MRYRFEDIAVNSTAKKKPTAADKDTYLGLEHLDSGSLTVTRFGSDVAPIGEKLVMKKGDVLFGKRRAYQKKVAIAPFDGIFSAHGMVLRPKENIVDKDFFPLFISSDYFLDAAIKISVGSLSPTINWSALKELEFSLPSLPEQRKLADLLWAANAAREAYKKLLAAADKLVKAQFVEMFGDPTKNPKQWETKELKDICTKLNDGTHFSPDNYPVGEFKYITAKNIKPDGFDFSNLSYVSGDVHNEVYTRCNPEYGDILYIKDGATTGIAMINTLDEPFTLLSSVALLKHNRLVINEYYLREALNNENMYISIRGNMDGAAITRLTVAKLKAIVLPLPPLPLQSRFADFVRAADKSKVELQKTIDELEVTYKAILRENLG